MLTTRTLALSGKMNPDVNSVDTLNGASVICGGVHTANATGYMIDQVMPPAKK